MSKLSVSMTCIAKLRVKMNFLTKKLGDLICRGVQGDKKSSPIFFSRSFTLTLIFPCYDMWTTANNTQRDSAHTPISISCAHNTNDM